MNPARPPPFQARKFWTGRWYAVVIYKCKIQSEVKQKLFNFWKSCYTTKTVNSKTKQILYRQSFLFLNFFRVDIFSENMSYIQVSLSVGAFILLKLAPFFHTSPAIHPVLTSVAQAYYHVTMIERKKEHAPCCWITFILHWLYSTYQWLWSIKNTSHKTICISTLFTFVF